MSKFRSRNGCDLMNRFTTLEDPMKTRFKLLTPTLIAIVIAGALSAAGAAFTSDSPDPGSGEPTLAEVRRLTERFRDVNTALAEGYVRDPADLCETAVMM